MRFLHCMRTAVPVQPVDRLDVVQYVTKDAENARHLAKEERKGLGASRSPVRIFQRNLQPRNDCFERFIGLKPRFISIG